MGIHVTDHITDLQGSVDMERSTAASGQGGPLRAYYVAVGSADAKLGTLVELLEALSADARLAVAVACSSRDSLDAVVAASARSGKFNLAVLHSDMEQHDMEQQVLQLKRGLQSLSHCQRPDGTQQQSFVASVQPQPGQPQPSFGVTQVPQSQPPQQLQEATVPAAANWQQLDNRSIVLVASDVCLKALHRDLLPLGLSLLIQYDLPSSKDVLQRRLACVFGSSKERSSRKGSPLVVIDVVVAGQLAAFRNRERMSSMAVQEMPVHVQDVFA